MSYQNGRMFPPGLEPGTFRVLGERDNHYTTETAMLTQVLYVAQNETNDTRVPAVHCRRDSESFGFPARIT